MYLKRIISYSLLSLIAVGGFFGSVGLEGVKGDDTGIIGITIDIDSGYASAVDEDCTSGGAVDASGKPCKATPTSAVAKYNDLIDTINIALGVLSAIISPAVLFVGWLMSPDWTSGDLFGLRPRMYSLWVTVSNIVYFVYAILLILIALGTMFGHDKFSYKVMLPKLALGILMVPFTWWFVQWTISISSVVTASVMTIPLETMGKLDSKWMNNETIPKEIIFNGWGSGELAKEDEAVTCDKGGCMAPKEFLTTAGGMYGPLVVYAYSVFKFEKIKDLSSGVDIVSAALQLVHTSLVSAIMFGVFGLLVLALTAMLVIRAIKLWVYAIFAPLFTFRFVAGSNMMGGGEDTFSIKEFIGLAFVPAIVGLTLSFGLIMISAVQSTGGPGGVSTEPCILIDNPDGCKIMNIMGSPDSEIRRWLTLEEGTTKSYLTQTTFSYGSLDFVFLGKSTNQSADTVSTTSGTLEAVGGMFGTLIVDMIALVFIWLAFMAAKNVSKAVSMAVQPFEDIGNKIGGLAKSIPKYVPLPIPGGSLAGLGMTADLTKSKFETAMRAKEEKSIGKMFPGLVEGLIKAEDMAKLEKTMKDNNGNTSANISNITKAMGDAANKGNVDKNVEAFGDRVKGSMDEARIKALFSDKRITEEKDQRILTAILSGKSNTLNSTEKETGWKKIQSWGTGGTDETNKTNTYASSEVVVNGPNKRINVNIEGVPVQLDANGQNIAAISPENLKKIQDKVKDVTEAQFKEKLSGVNSDVQNTLLKKIKENNFKFKE